MSIHLAGSILCNSGFQRRYQPIPGAGHYRWFGTARTMPQQKARRKPGSSEGWALMVILKPLLSHRL
jgi:hypothetical protein